MEMRKHFSYIVIKNALYSQAGIGISANIFLLLHISIFLGDAKPKPTDLTIIHLAVTHIMMLLTMELLVSTDILEAQDIQRDFKCKVLFFFHKMLRCLSICTTCLLSVLQAITIGPSSSWWAKFKPKSPSPTLCLFLFFWVLNISIGGNLLLYTVAIPSETCATLLFLTEHCSILPMSYTHKALFFTLMAFRDVSFMGPMALSSGYILILLYRHKQRSQHLHSKHLSPRSSPGQRATQTILLLVRCFVIMYCVGLIISFSIAMTWMNNPILVCIQMTVANGCGTVSPLVLISAEKQIIKTIQTIWGRKASI